MLSWAVVGTDPNIPLINFRVLRHTGALKLGTFFYESNSALYKILK